MKKQNVCIATVSILLSVLVLPAVVSAKSSGISSVRSSVSAPRVSTPKVSTPSTSTSTRTSVSSTPKTSVTPTPKVSTRPTTTTKTVAAPVKTTASGKTTTGKASMVDSTYRPTFSGGYTPPIGSSVQYVERSSSFIDYLPWIYIFSQSSRDKVNQQEAVVTEPGVDGAPGVEKTVVMDEGGDGLLIFNWIIMILLGGGIIWGIMWIVNKLTTKKSYV